MSGIKQGVSLYSLQDAYGRGGLGLEGVLKAVSGMGTEGIEILSDQMIVGAQRASEGTLAQWDTLMKKYPLHRVANDIFINSTLYRNRRMTHEEEVESLKADLRLTHRLGFHLVRLVSRTDPAVIRPCLDLATELDVAMCVEVHAGMSFDNPLTKAWIKEMRALENEYVGIVVDFGIFCQRHPRVATEYFRRMGVHDDVITYIDDIFAAGIDPRQAFLDSYSTDTEDVTVFPEDLKALIKSPLDEFHAMMSTGYENTPLDVLDEYLPYIKSFHGKFWEMTDKGEEYSINYKRVIDRPKTLGFEGYICSEYEGQRFAHPGDPIHDVEQVRRHQDMLRRLINEED